MGDDIGKGDLVISRYQSGPTRYDVFLVITFVDISAWWDKRKVHRYCDLLRSDGMFIKQIASDNLEKLKTLKP